MQFAGMSRAKCLQCGGGKCITYFRVCPNSPLINCRDRCRHTAYRLLYRKVAQYAVPPMLGLDFINGLLRQHFVHYMFLFASDLSERRDDVSSYFVFSLLWWRLLHKTAE